MYYYCDSYHWTPSLVIFWVCAPYRNVSWHTVKMQKSLLNEWPSEVVYDPCNKSCLILRSHILLYTKVSPIWSSIFSSSIFKWFLVNFKNEMHLLGIQICNHWDYFKRMCSWLWRWFQRRNFQNILSHDCIIVQWCPVEKYFFKAVWLFFKCYWELPEAEKSAQYCDRFPSFWVSTLVCVRTVICVMKIIINWS